MLFAPDLLEALSLSEEPGKGKRRAKVGTIYSTEASNKECKSIVKREGLTYIAPRSCERKTGSVKRRQTTEGNSSEIHGQTKLLHL